MLVFGGPLADVLATTRVEFRTDKGEWRVEGTATVTTGNAVKIHLGNDLTGPIINGSAGSAVDALGVWSFRIPNGPQPTATRTISLESTRGGVRLAIPIVVRN